MENWEGRSYHDGHFHPFLGKFSKFKVRKNGFLSQDWEIKEKVYLSPLLLGWVKLNVSLPLKIIYSVGLPVIFYKLNFTHFALHLSVKNYETFSHSYMHNNIMLLWSLLLSRRLLEREKLINISSSEEWSSNKLAIVQLWLKGNTITINFPNSFSS